MNSKVMLTEINNAIGAHGAWKLKLRTAIDRKSSDASPDNVKCDDQCAFGKWLYGPLMSAEIKDGMPYMVVLRLHAEFHECAAGVLEDALGGKSVRAKATFDGEFKARSQTLVQALNKWKNEIMAEQRAAA